MEQDPFLEAGITIPPELPYQKEGGKDNKARGNFISRITSITSATETKSYRDSTKSQQSMKSLRETHADIATRKNHFCDMFTSTEMLLCK